jgi:serine kinase of HPr protein (carbohydrate metabolism regulator)
MSDRSPVHATGVAVHEGGGRWRGLLILGPSGAGKSDLALRLIGRGARLVADDYCHVWTSAGRLYAAAPGTIAGRIEARGLGIVAAPMRSSAPVVLAVACVTGPVERLPEPEVWRFGGLEVPLLRLDPRPASAVEIALGALRGVAAL